MGEIPSSFECLGARGGHGHRPSNPMYGSQIQFALVRCGFDVLPDLLELITHPNAHHLVFGAIARILAQPWMDRQPKQYWTPSIYGMQAKLRREAELIMLQPDPTLQAETDKAARKLTALLGANLQLVDAAKPPLLLAYSRARPNYLMAT